MKAMTCEGPGGPDDLKLIDLPDPTPDSDEVAIDVKAAAVNFGDTFMIGRPRPATERVIPGYECAGIVTKVGEHVSGFSVGDRVMAFLFSGGYADKAVAKAAYTHRLPPEMDFASGAGFIATYGTAYHALKDRADIQPSETLLVLGAAGGSGLAAVEVGHALGARVIAAASTPEKLALCKSHGADETINYTTQNIARAVAEMTDNKGVDVIFDPVGGQIVEQLVDSSTAPECRLLIIGFASGKFAHVPTDKMLFRQLTTIGLIYGEALKANPAAGGIKALLTWYRQKRLRPLVSETYPLSQAGAAMKQLTSRAAKGKVILSMG